VKKGPVLPVGGKKAELDWRVLLVRCRQGIPRKWKRTPSVYVYVIKKCPTATLFQRAFWRHLIGTLPVVPENQFITSKDKTLEVEK
jgi:hypothetical protein